MTRPKFRPCPSCQTPNQASRKSCYVCFGSLSTKQKINDKVVSLDSQWGQSVKKSRNVGRIIDSARIAVRKLEAVGYKPILFIGKQNKKTSNKWVADIITHLHPTPVTRNFLEKMRRAYEFILTKATSTAQQLDSDIPIAEQHNSPSQEQCSGSILEPESLIVEQPECLIVEQPESLTVEQPESLIVEQPESLTVEQPESLTLFLCLPHTLQLLSLLHLLLLLQLFLLHSLLLHLHLHCHALSLCDRGRKGQKPQSFHQHLLPPPSLLHLLSPQISPFHTLVLHLLPLPSPSP